MRERPFARLSPEAPEPTWSSDRRLARRRRTRLRSAKLYDDEGRFLLDCRLVDRSLLGVRVATGYHGDLPARLAIYDDEKCETSDAEIMWRDGDVCGLSLRGRPRGGAAVRAHFGSPFYAIGTGTSDAR